MITNKQKLKQLMKVTGLTETNHTFLNSLVLLNGVYDEFEIEKLNGLHAKFIGYSEIDIFISSLK